ncbi:MAG: hypothetical protein MJ201_01845 [Mycoplasmoidaceae bacterium]|nr:hypothetical protein [Mycoplasmoidaceae bacterium]
MNGHNVCIIGLTTKGTLVDGNLNAIKDLAFIDYNASVTYTKTLAKSELGEEKFNSIEAFILLTHCECQPNSVDPTIIEGEAADLAKNATTRIDGILAAHSHRECSGLIKNEKFGNMIPVAQASQAGRRYVDTKLVFNDGKPVGQRLESISMNVKTPFIDYGKNDPTKPEELEKAKACARKQLNDIIDNTKNKVVKKTIEEYTKQKEVALRELDKPLGVLKDDVHYYFTEHPERSFGTQYMQSDTLIEPAGA